MPTPVSTKQIIVVPDDIGDSFKSSPNIERLKKIATVEFHNERASGETELSDRVRNANVILSFRPAFTKFSKSVLKSLSTARNARR